MSVVTLRQLEVFAQVVEHGGFRRCAEHIGVSQVAVSDHVRALEAALGHALFERRPGSPAILTAAGAEAYKRVRDVLAEVEELIWDFSPPPKEGARRRIVVAMHPVTLSQMQFALEDYKREHPEIEIALELELYAKKPVEDALLARKIDLAFYLAPEDEEDPGSEFIRREPLAFYAGKDHPLAARARVSLEDIKSCPAIRLASHSPLQTMTNWALDKIGLGRPEIALETDNFGLMASSLERNLGVATLFSSVEFAYSPTGLLKRLNFEREIPSLSVRLKMRRALYRSTQVKDLAKRLSEGIAKA